MCHLANSLRFKNIFLVLHNIPTNVSCWNCRYKRIIESPNGIETIFEMRKMKTLLIGCLSTVLSISAHSQGVKLVTTENYTIELPAAWQTREMIGPTGGRFVQYAELQNKKASSYCQVEILKLDPKQTPKLANLNEKQERAVFSEIWDVSMWKVIYSNLPSANDFQIINSYPSLIGQDKNAQFLDFIFSVPQGIFYRMRAVISMGNNKNILSLWCGSIGKSKTEANNNFNYALPQMIAIQKSFTPLRTKLK